MPRHSRFLPIRGLLIVALLGFHAGCTDTPDEVDGQGAVRAVHAIPDLSTVSFLIEETQLGALEYLQTGTFSDFDALDYDFNFDFASAATGESERLISTTQTLADDTTYTFVLHGTATNPRVTTLTAPFRLFDAGETVLEVWFSNFASSGGPVDFYVGEVGFDVAAATPIAANIAPAAASAIVEIESLSAELVVTAAGDPSTILLRSEPTTLAARDTLLVSLIDAGGEVDGDFALSVGGQVVNGILIDDRVPPSAQFVNVSFASGAIDIYLNTDLQNPIVSSLAVGAFSPPIAIPEADDLQEITLTVTPAGNPGVILLEEPELLSDARTSLVFFSGRQADDNLLLIPNVASRRPVFDAARFGLFNAVQDVDFINFFLLEEDESVTTELPRARRLGGSLGVDEVTLVPELLDAVVTNFEDDAIRGGPLPVNLVAGGIYRLVTIDTADPAATEILVLEFATAP